MEIFDFFVFLQTGTINDWAECRYSYSAEKRRFPWARAHSPAPFLLQIMHMDVTIFPNNYYLFYLFDSSSRRVILEFFNLTFNITSSYFRRPLPYNNLLRSLFRSFFESIFYSVVSSSGDCLYIHWEIINKPIKFFIFITDTFLALKSNHIALFG